MGFRGFDFYFLLFFFLHGFRFLSAGGDGCAFRLFAFRVGGELGGIRLQIEGFLEGDQLVLDTFLLALHRVGGRAVGLQGLVHQVLRLEDIAFEHAAAEIVVEREGHGVVDVRRHDVGGIDIGTEVFVRNPEHRHGVLSHIVHDRQDRADRQCLDIEDGVVLVEIPGFLHVVGTDIAGRDVTFVHDKAGRFVIIARCLFVKDAATVEHHFQVELAVVAEVLVTIEIFISGELPLTYQLKDDGKQIHLPVHRLGGVI